MHRLSILPWLASILYKLPPILSIGYIMVVLNVRMLLSNVIVHRCQRYGILWIALITGDGEAYREGVEEGCDG